MKVLISILGSKKEPYETILREGAYKTWASIPYDNVLISPYYSTNGLSYWHGNDLFVVCDDIDYTRKTVEAFNEYLQRDWDFMLRTNISTYVNVPKLYKFLESKHRERYYAGNRDETIENVVSGTMMLFSRDVVELIAKNRHTIYGNPDDVRIGQFLLSRGITVVEHLDRMDYQDQNLSLIEDPNPNYIFYRLKTNRLNGVINNNLERNDHIKMKKLWEKGL